MTCTLDSLTEYVGYQLQDLPDNGKQFAHWKREQVESYVRNAISTTYGIASNKKNLSKTITLTGPGCVFNITDEQCPEVMRILKVGSCVTPKDMTERQKVQLAALRGCNRDGESGEPDVDFDLDSPNVLTLSRDLAEGESIDVTIICKTETEIDYENIPSVMCTKHKAAIFQHVLADALEMNDDIDSREQAALHWARFKDYMSMSTAIRQEEYARHEAEKNE